MGLGAVDIWRVVREVTSFMTVPGQYLSLQGQLSVGSMGQSLLVAREIPGKIYFLGTLLQR